MPTPFPGMDPYLEGRGLWHQVHTQLIVDVGRALSAQVRPRYRVAIRERVYLDVWRPDPLLVTSTAPIKAGDPVIGELPMPEEVTERFLEIQAVNSGDVITAIELLSPTNKRPGRGRQVYEEKRLQILGSQTHLVEIDLLRSTPPMEMYLPPDEDADYRIVISRTTERPRASIYLFGIQQPIPTIPVPLRQNDPEPLLDLNSILHDLYDRASFDLLINYSHAPIPPLTQVDAEWSDALLREQQRRS